MNAAEKTMNQFYQGKLAERLMQAASMERNRQLLRRGALKMQDGTLGEPSGGLGVDDNMNIHIGDVTQQLPQSTAPQATQAPSLAKWALLAAGLLGSGGLGAAIPWIAGAYEHATTIESSTQELGVGVEVIPGGGTQ